MTFTENILSNCNTPCKKGAFYGRRHGKSLRAHQSFLLTEFLKNLSISIDEKSPSDIKEIFPFSKQKKKLPLYLEIGFGGGEHLLHALNFEKNALFIGAEPFVNGMAKLLAGLYKDRENTERIRLFSDDAIFLLDWLPSHCLDRIDLFYPDPWPKKRHWKRRFVNKENLDRFARVLKKQALFRFASDIEDYVEWTIKACAAHKDFIFLNKEKQNWQNPYEDWIPTRYEQKALREGRKPNYLIFQNL